MKSLTSEELRRIRMASQGLRDRASTTVAGAARRSGGIQAQAAGPARLAVRARTTGLVAADVDDACATPTVVRSWLMRSTLHMVAAEDLRWLLSLFGPANLRLGRRRRDQLALTDDLCERALAAIGSVLAGRRALTRAQLVAELVDHGVVIDPKTQAPAHLLLYAASQGLVCRGPEADSDEPTYVLVDDWLGPDRRLMHRDEALAELAVRYFAAYGPATVADFAAWSGLPVADCRRGVDEARPELAQVASGDEVLFTLCDTRLPAGSEGEGGTRLLGRFDAYLLGHRSRGLVLDPGYAERVNAGGGMIAPVIVVDGRVVGTWRLDRSRKVARFVLDPFAGPTGLPEDGLDAEVADLARFLGLEDYERTTAQRR
jgi:hypothetical protein